MTTANLSLEFYSSEFRELFAAHFPENFAYFSRAEAQRRKGRGAKVDAKIALARFIFRNVVF